MPAEPSLPPPARVPEGLRVHLLAAASMSEAVHQHLAKLPNPLRGLKPHQPGCDAADKLPPSTKAAVHGGAVFVTGVIVSSGLQLLARLHEFHQQHLDGGTADTTQRPRRRFGLLRGFGHRAHAHHHKEHAYVVVTDVKTHRCTPCVNTNASLSNIPRGAHGLAERAWDQQRRCNPHGAIPYLEQALASNPTNTDLLVLIAKQWSDSSFLPDCPADQRIPVNEKALSYSTKATESAPNSAMAYVASSMSKGRLAYWSKDNKTKILLAKQAQDDVVTALSLDPSNDLAHHLMGRWHYEMAQLNFVVRGLVRVLYGTALIPGSVPEALASYTRAAELNPGRLVHQVEMGRMCERLGMHEDALKHLKHSLELEVEDINSEINRQEALAMISQLERRRPALAAPAVQQGSTSVPGLPKPQWSLPKAPWSTLALPTVPVEA